MKPIFAKVMETMGEDLFAVRVTQQQAFSTDYHFHKECQLTYIVQSQGKRLIGDHFDYFISEDLTLTGTELPHVWYTDVIESDKEHHAHSIALFFDPDRLVEILSSFHDTEKLQAFLLLSKRGIRYEGKCKEQIKKLLYKLLDAQGLKRIIIFLQIIEKLQDASDKNVLCHIDYSNIHFPNNALKIDKIVQYVLTNYSREISLEEIAVEMNLSKNAFCRYFKTQTQKTFVQFVNEVRIMQACKLIVENQLSIHRVAYDCGFNSLSNFNRVFKTIKNQTPSEFKNALYEVTTIS
ncbi:AraC family transcriptional regulator [Sphingobacterium anhuiense]|uniref:AraC family transcriptional regulator n=1 Tax=Sphingobacterium anhuiense TaxID=493780 RepID=UPI003C30B0BD